MIKQQARRAAPSAPLAIDAELRQLAALEGAGSPVISLYLNVRGRDQHERETARTFVRQAVTGAARSWRGDAPGRAPLEADLARVDRHVSMLLGRRGGRPPGLALFVSGPADLFAEFHSPLPFRNQFGMGRAPLLAQLSALADAYEPALVALVDAASARIFTCTLGGVLTELALSGNVPGRHKQGGWSQARYQRHIRAHEDDHHKAVAGVLVGEMREREISHLILGGPREARLNLRSLLPPGDADRIVAELDLPVRAPVGRIEEAARGALQAWERREAAAAVRALQERAGEPALVSLGLDSTVAAVNRRGVHQLLLADTFAADGWSCQACGELQAETVLACPRCGGEVASADLREALVGAVLRSGGRVEWVTGQPDLDRAGGVAAFLQTWREKH